MPRIRFGVHLWIRGMLVSVFSGFIMEIPLVLTFSAFGMELDEVYATPTPQEKLRGEAELPQHLQKPEVRLR